LEINLTFRSTFSSSILVPEVKFETYPDFSSAGADEASFVITIRNPIQHSTTVKIVPLNYANATDEANVSEAASEKVWLVVLLVVTSV
jgi:hypothetical protein